MSAASEAVGELVGAPRVRALTSRTGARVARVLAAGSPISRSARKKRSLGSGEGHKLLSAADHPHCARRSGHLAWAGSAAAASLVKRVSRPRLRMMNDSDLSTAARCHHRVLRFCPGGTRPLRPKVAARRLHAHNLGCPAFSPLPRTTRLFSWCGPSAWLRPSVLAWLPGRRFGAWSKKGRAKKLCEGPVRNLHPGEDSRPNCLVAPARAQSRDGSNPASALSRCRYVTAKIPVGVEEGLALRIPGQGRPRLRSSMKIGSPRPLQKMQPHFPTATVGSSQAPTATVEKTLLAPRTQKSRQPHGAPIMMPTAGLVRRSLQSSNGKRPTHLLPTQVDPSI